MVTDKNEKTELTRRISTHVTKLPPIPEDIDRLLQEAARPDRNDEKITDREKAVLGLNHCEVGEQVCRRRGLTPALREAVARHHTPLLDDTDLSYAGALLFLAHFVAGSDFTGEILSQLIP